MQHLPSTVCTMNHLIRSPHIEKDLQTPPFTSPPADYMPPLPSDSRLPSPMSPKKKTTIAPPLFLEPTPKLDTHQQALSMFSINLYPTLPVWSPRVSVPLPLQVANHQLHLRKHTDAQEEYAAAEALAAVSADAFGVAANCGVEAKPGAVPSTTVQTSPLPSVACSITATSPEPITVSAVDQSMFLTKDAHIKRPRNAWIHFRCHYGQAIKAKDPSLRAEEISRRASRRWAQLTEKEKKPWHDLADQEKQAHKEAFPEYRYCPKRTLSAQCDSSLFQLTGGQSNSDESRSKRAKRQTA